MAETAGGGWKCLSCHQLFSHREPVLRIRPIFSGSDFKNSPDQIPSGPCPLYKKFSQVFLKYWIFLNTGTATGFPLKILFTLI
jgi:hypothetical protein